MSLQSPTLSVRCRSNFLLLYLLISLSGMLHAQGAPVVASGTFCTQQAGWQSMPVGSSGMWNAANYASGTFTVSGIGSQINGTADSFGFAYERLTGDGSIVARIVSMQGGSLAGVMIRETLAAGSTNATTANWNARETSYFDIRATTGGSTTQAGSGTASLPAWVKLVRSGNGFSSYSSSDGVTWTQVGANQTANMMQSVYIGLAVTGGSSSSPATATFDHVSVTSSGTPLPCITSLSATSGDLGSQVVIIGSGFGNAQSNSQVLLNGAPVTINFWNNTTISATIRGGATTGSLWVHQPSSASSSNDSNSVMFSVTSQPVVWGWMDYDLGSETFTADTSSGGGGGGGGTGGQLMDYGSATYANETFTVNGSGLQIYGNADSSHFLYQQLSGDGSIVARLVSVQGASGWWAAAGLMIRETLSSSSASVALVDSPSPGTFGFQVRPTTNGNTNQIAALSLTPAYWMKLSRSGNSFSAFTSPDGINWAQLGTSQTISMAQNVYVGLSVTSANNSTLATATFDNVSVSASVGSAPLINTISATTGMAGTQVLISGSGFGNAQGNSQVTLNTAPVTINFWSNTFISVTIPSGATTGDLVVSVAPSMNDSNPVWFTVTSEPLPTGWLDRDVGTVNVIGASSYSNGTFTVSGSGYQIYSSADAFHFAYQQLAGDGSITARVVSMQASGWWAAAGIMIRETMDAGATNAAVVEAPQPNYFGFQARTATNGSSGQFGTVSATPPYWVKLTRSGSNFSGYTSADGATWTQVGWTQTINMTQAVYVGLAVESGSASSLATATFDNVTVVSSLQSPTVGSLQPSSGSEEDSVTISGSNFGAPQGNSTVSFGGVQATSIQSWSGSQIIATVPSGTATGPVSVVSNSLQSNQNVIFTVSTIISGISPDSGAVLSEIQISGSGFGALQGQSAVTLNGASVPVLNWSPASVTVLVPAGATTGNIVITVGGVAITGPTFTVITITPPAPTIPSIGGISAPSGGVGTQVTINGSGFGADQGTGSLVLGTALGIITLWRDDMIQANVSAGSTSGIVQVQQGGYSSNSLPFTVTGLPNISSIGVNNGAPGDPVTISGSGFGNSQGNGIVMIGTVPGVVTNWQDGTIQATVSAGSASGVVQVLQNGAWSNSLAFTINIPYIRSIDHTSGGADTNITITGSGFGNNQGNGIVWIGSMPGVVNGWSDTQVVASVASNSVSGIVKVQQNGIWSNAVTFTVPVTLQGGTQVTLLPNVVSMVVGENRTEQALDSNNQPVTGLTWTSSDTNIATLSTDDPPAITAVAPGNVTITAGGASTDVTVYEGPTLPVGTVIWSNPGNGSGVSKIMPAVPSMSGLADVFALQNDGTVQAIKSDGSTAWTANTNGATNVIPDFQGGLTLASPSSLQKLDGMTGQAYQSYSVSDPNDTLSPPVAHTDSTVFSVYTSNSANNAYMVGVDPTTGQEKFRVAMDQSSDVVSCSGDVCDGFNANGTSPPIVLAAPIIAGDGYAYLPYEYWTQNVQMTNLWICYGLDSVGTTDMAAHLMLLRVGSDGSSSKIDVKDWKSTVAFQDHWNSCSPPSLVVQNGIIPSLQPVSIITNADQGVVLGWEADFPDYCTTQSYPVFCGGEVPATSAFGLATTSASVASSTSVNIPGQAGPIVPILQAQDGSFFGTVGTGPQPGQITQTSMISFDSSGNLRWSVPNDSPKIATSDGGVIGTSGSRYDRNGNATGQVNNRTTQSWVGNDYQLGSVELIAEDAFDIASNFWPQVDANQSQNRAAKQQLSAKLELRTGGNLHPLPTDPFTQNVLIDWFGETLLGMQSGGFPKPPGYVAINGCYAGYELVATVTPAGSAGPVTIKRSVKSEACWVSSSPTGCGKPTPPYDDTGFHVSTVPSADPNGQLFNLDAVGYYPFLGLNNPPYRHRVNFEAYAVAPDGTQISKKIDYYIRLSCQTNSNGVGYFSTDVPGDNILGTGTTPITPNLQ